MAGLSDLPVELISLIVDYSAASAPPFALRQTLSRIALIHHHFTKPAQSRLFHSVTINTSKQLLSLATLLAADVTGRLGSYVGQLSAVSEGDRLATAQLNSLQKLCPNLESVQLSSMGVDLSVIGDRKLTDCSVSGDPAGVSRREPVGACGGTQPGQRWRMNALELSTPHIGVAVLGQVNRLRLENITLILAPSLNKLPAVEHLTVSNVHLCLPSHSAHDAIEATLVLPSLTSLDFDYSLAPHLCPDLPVLTLDMLTSTTLSTLTIRLLSNPATDGPTSTAPSPLTAASTPPAPPTLALFPALTSLTLLADSSYRTPLYFPLLKTLPEPSPLARFAVLVDLGYRDQELEVKEMAAELAVALAEGKGLGVKLGMLRLPRVFERFAAGDGMLQLRQAAKANGVTLDYSVEK